MNRWMQLAYNSGVEGVLKGDGGPFGAVIVQNEEIIAQAHNEVLRSNDPTAHAEVLAIRRASAYLKRFDLSDCTLYTTCKPCPMCLGAVMWARIPKVYYGTSEKDAAAIGFDDANFYEFIAGKKPFISMQQIDYEESKKLFEIWMQQEKKVLY
jgi:guanine deaminase